MKYERRISNGEDGVVRETKSSTVRLLDEEKEEDSCCFLFFFFVDDEEDINEMYFKVYISKL